MYRVGTQNVAQEMEYWAKLSTLVSECHPFGPLFHFLCDTLHLHPVQCSSDIVASML